MFLDRTRTLVSQDWTWADLGRLWPTLGRGLGRSWANLGPTLGRLVANLGSTFGRLLANFRAAGNWADIGYSATNRLGGQALALPTALADFGPTLGRLWANFGPTLHGPTLGRLWADFEMQWSVCLAMVLHVSRIWED